MVVPKCHVLEFVTETQPDNWVRGHGVRVVDASAAERTVSLAPSRPDGRQSVVVLALGDDREHARGPYTFQARSPAARRASEWAEPDCPPALEPEHPGPAGRDRRLPIAGALQVSALFVKGQGSDRRRRPLLPLADTLGLGRFGNDSEAELVQEGSPLST
jgi:hypothetical protein